MLWISTTINYTHIKGIKLFHSDYNEKKKKLVYLHHFILQFIISFLSVNTNKLYEEKNNYTFLSFQCLIIFWKSFIVVWRNFFFFFVPSFLLLLLLFFFCLFLIKSGVSKKQPKFKMSTKLQYRLTYNR